MSSRGRSGRRGRRGRTSVRDDPWSSLDHEYSPNNIPEFDHPEIVPGANLQRAQLQEFDLFGRDIREAHLENAHLERAYLQGAHLERAYLQGAHLGGAQLQGAHLEGANLTGAHLEGANLTGAYLVGADFTGVDLTRVIMGEEQRHQIEYSISHRLMLQLDQQQLLHRPMLHRPMQHQPMQHRPMQQIIPIPRELLTPTYLDAEPKNNSVNESCPDYTDLFNFIMQQELSDNFKFEFEGEPLQDLAGLSRMVFDKILPVYVNKLFKESGDFILFKERLNPNMIRPVTEQLIKLAKAAHSQIQLKINPLVIELLSKPDLKENISKRPNFKELYNNLKKKVKNSKQVQSNFNISNFLINNTLKPIINAAKGNLDALSEDIKAEILFRKTLNEFGFTSWDQYNNMKKFIKSFWNISKQNKVTFSKNGRTFEVDLFIPEINFDVESFKERLKLITSEIRYIDLTAPISDELLNSYPALRPLLRYIFDERPEADKNRRTFAKYCAGTEYYPGELRILLTRRQMSPQLYRGSPFYGRSCDARVDLFMAPPGFNGTVTVNAINIALKANTSSLQGRG